MSNLVKKNKYGAQNKGRIRVGFEGVGDRGANGAAPSDIKRLSINEEKGRIKGGARNVAATYVLRGYDGADFKAQQAKLTEFAKANDCWFTIEEIEDEFGKEIFDRFEEILGEKSPSRGMEARIYRYDENHFLKVYKYGYFNNTPLDFMDNRIALHNKEFPETYYELVCFVEGRQGNLCFALKQPVIIGVQPTEKDIDNEMLEREYKKHEKEAYVYISKCGNYIIEDQHVKNWIKGFDGKMYCIDSVLKLNPQNRKYENI